MKHWDAIVIGAGIIGLSLAIELAKSGLKVLIVEKAEPGREASWAAGGMLADSPIETKPALCKLAAASAEMYPEFVHELEDESRMKIDLRDQGTLLFMDRAHETKLPNPGQLVTQVRLSELEPGLIAEDLISKGSAVCFLKERSVDPRNLTTAAIAAAKHRGIDFSSGNPVLGITMSNGKAAGVRTSKTDFSAGIVVNCAGAWAGQIEPHAFPSRPVKGQMLCVVMPQKETVRHVIRTPDVYLIPRSDGRMVIGATQEEAGFDKRTVPETIQKLRNAAVALAPRVGEARMLEAWAGLRPGTPDALPILGATPVPNYFVATGHFRDGILLAPVTAQVMGQLIAGEKPAFALDAFASTRFSDQALCGSKDGGAATRGVPGNSRRPA
ncbi:MAG: glycine oxidase ThiO [Terriglobales bacterium]